MTMACITFDTLSFVKRLEAAGVEPKIAEAQAELQADLQKQILEKFAEYQPILDELKIKKDELATKSDLNVLRNELIIKLGGIVVASVTVLGVAMALTNHIR